MRDPPPGLQMLFDWGFCLLNFLHIFCDSILFWWEILCQSKCCFLNLFIFNQFLRLFSCLLFSAVQVSYFIENLLTYLNLFIFVFNQYLEGIIHGLFSYCLCPLNNTIFYSLYLLTVFNIFFLLHLGYFLVVLCYFLFSISFFKYDRFTFIFS